MSLIPGSILEPPPRRLKPSVHISDDPVPSLSSSNRRVIKGYFADLTVERAALLSELLAQLPSIVRDVRKEHEEQTRREMRAAFTLPVRAIQYLTAEAWVHERWHAIVLKELSCITFAEADSRCEVGPWDVRSDLLVLAHQGRSHVPLFQFDSNNAPAASWITLVAVLRGESPTPSDWDILAWLLRPHPLLQDRSPLSVQPTNPQRVRQLAYSNRRERLL
jgi:hypothetical protein